MIAIKRNSVILQNKLCNKMCDCEKIIESLKAVIADKDKEIEILKKMFQKQTLNTAPSPEINTILYDSKITQDEVKRYSRQLILPEISVEGQIALKKAKVLIVGAGGLGCPVAMYLTAAGIGTIGIVDYDKLDISNLHRQIAHSEKCIGEDKCLSLKHSLLNLNSSIVITSYSLLLNSKNASDIINQYDIIVDASDNVPTRYLLNDAAVLFNKVLVSGSALKFEGQLTVYNYLEGPCYRCLFPEPPLRETITNCSDGGVIGPVTGVIGSLQALEVIKIITGLDASYSKKMLVFDGLTGTIRIFKLRNKRIDCDVCGENPSVTKLIDYELFCNTKACDKDMHTLILSDSERISCTEYKKKLDSNVPHVLIDVRPENEMRICHLSNAINIPIDKIGREVSLVEIKDAIEKTKGKQHYVICRRGNDSQKAVQILQKHFPELKWYDIIGGLYAWHDEIDSTLPLY